MKFLRFLLILLLIIGLAVLGLVLTGNSYLLQGVWATYLHGEKSATISDARFFDLRDVPATNPQPWPIAEDYNQRKLSDTLKRTLDMTESVAFLVVKNDSILFEKYWHGYSDTSHSNSFSMAKSITTMLVQKAIEEGYIKSWEDKVIDYLPQLQGPYRKELKLKHLSKMTAGLKWNEHYSNPFDITARAYYSSDISEVMFERVPVVREPGTGFEYQSGAPQLLGMVLSAATGKSVSEYAAETLWKSMGAQETAWWHLDDEGGTELTYCCFNSNARDFARFGKLLEHNGQWNGEQVLDSTFVWQASHAGAAPYYGWSFWIYNDFLHHVYYMRGILGQYVIVIPEKDLVIVRLGKKRLEKVDDHPREIPVIINEVVKYFGA